MYQWIAIQIIGGMMLQARHVSYIFVLLFILAFNFECFAACSAGTVGRSVKTTCAVKVLFDLKNFPPTSYWDAGDEKVKKGCYALCQWFLVSGSTQLSCESGEIADTNSYGKCVDNSENPMPGPTQRILIPGINGELTCKSDTGKQKAQDICAKLDSDQKKSGMIPNLTPDEKKFIDDTQKIEVNLVCCGNPKSADESTNPTGPVAF